MRANGTVASSWFREAAVSALIHPEVPQYRLSGNAMRICLYFSTAPGDVTLYIAEKKNGIVTQLPVM
jgi:hypothetical protein